MVPQSPATIDGPRLGSAASAETVALHLRRWAAAAALSVPLVAEGGSWLWDRMAAKGRRAKLDGVPLHAVLDVVHAMPLRAMAVWASELNAEQRLPMHCEHRALLRNGQWRRVLAASISAGSSCRW
jgi:hypothetical protein